MIKIIILDSGNNFERDFWKIDKSVFQTQIIASIETVPKNEGENALFPRRSNGKCFISSVHSNVVN